MSSRIVTGFDNLSVQYPSKQSLGFAVGGAEVRVVGLGEGVRAGVLVLEGTLLDGRTDDGVPEALGRAVGGLSAEEPQPTRSRRSGVTEARRRRMSCSFGS
ncbi:hypothetical protein SPAR_11022 [Streptomyces sparsogenes DSM 40356]|uniref:Uncharacterized protein n=1 Tax=Streptomyces sparsogenes DSM 40356 TaxID=1331668 RepID=A0A1R1SM25_9ACTN|nr:hypothetical protein SPAR_11022 [Streptomyces sparsogenes DSM 40356]